MGEYAEMMLDGTCCACCGEYIGSENGFATYCASCEPDFIDPEPTVIKPRPAKAKTNCPVCGKRVKVAGVEDHMRDVHGGKDSE